MTSSRAGWLAVAVLAGSQFLAVMSTTRGQRGAARDRAPSTGALLVGRVLQGLGPVLLVPGSLTIIRALFDDERRRAQAIGLWSTGSAARASPRSRSP